MESPGHARHLRHPVTLTLALAVGLFALVAQAAAAPPSPGAPGIGDRLFPTLGNGGYTPGITTST